MFLWGNPHSSVATTLPDQGKWYIDRKRGTQKNLKEIEMLKRLSKGRSIVRGIFEEGCEKTGWWDQKNWVTEKRVQLWSNKWSRDS